MYLQTEAMFFHSSSQCGRRKKGRGRGRERNTPPLFFHYPLPISTPVLIFVSFYFIRPASDSLDNRSMELKLKEPELAPERNPRDYTVHFPQDKSHDPAVTKSYKTSGPVIPDTIRYQ